MMPAPQRSAWVRHHQVQAQMHPSVLSLRCPLRFPGLPCRESPNTTCNCAQQSTGGVRLFHIQLACACMLLLFLLGLGMRARLLHDWASHGFADEDEYSSSEQFLSLFGLVSTTTQPLFRGSTPLGTRRSSKISEWQLARTICNLPSNTCFEQVHWGALCCC